MLKLFLKIIKYYGQERKLKITMFMLLSVFAGLLEFVGISLIYPILLLVLEPQTITNNSYIQHIVQIFDIQQAIMLSVILGILTVCLFITKDIIMILFTYLQNRFIVKWKNDINNRIMQNYIYAPYENIQAIKNHDKIYDVTTLTSNVFEIFVMRFFILISNSIIVFLILSLIIIQFRFAAIIVSCLIVLGLFLLNKIFKDKTTKLAPEMVKYSILNNSAVIENINSLKEIRIFGAEQHFLDKFKKIQKRNNEIITENSFYSSIPPYVIEIFMILVLVILAIFAAYQNLDNHYVIIADYGLLVTIAIRIAPLLNRIQTAMNNIRFAKNSASLIVDKYESGILDNVIKIQRNTDKINFINEIVFEHVSFNYKNCSEKVLRDVSFKIKRGEFVGILGLSGAGKSTVANIIMGLLNVTSGNFKIDKININEENIYGLRDIVGYVAQEINIINSDYRENVAFGEENINDKRVIEVLEQAQLLKMVEEKGGIYAKVSELSQGQKQRLMIARALYRNPEIIIFDEATSSLDVVTENEIVEMLTKLKGEKTIIGITHRLPTVKKCDKLLYLKDGIVSDSGTFDELESRYSDFKKLVNLSKI